MVLEYSPGSILRYRRALIMDNDQGRLVDGRHARRPHSAHSDGFRLCYPLAAGDTDKDDATYHEEEAEAPSAGPPVASSAQIQTHVPSFFQPLLFFP